MPNYEFACDPCRILYQTRLGINDPRPTSCRSCGGDLRRVVAAPMLNTRNFTSPTAAKYASLSERDELAKERELQKVYETVWIPPEAKHSPWDDDH